MELLGQVLIEKGVITLTQLNEARRKQVHAKPGKRRALGEVLCQLGYATPDEVAGALRPQAEEAKSRELSQPRPARAVLVDRVDRISERRRLWLLS